MDQMPDPGRKRQDKLEQLITAYENDLLRMCCVYLRDLALAQDAVQDTFLKAYKALDRFRGESSEKTWLMRIAVTVCRDYRRSAWHRYVDRRVNLDLLPLPTAPPKTEHIALTTEIMRLPRKQMEAVLLYYYQNLNIREIAQVVGISPAAVSSRLIKARKLLHDALKGGEGHES